MRRGFSLVLGAWERRPELVRRVQRILTQPARTMGRRPALAACGALIAGVFGCTLTLAHAPQLVSFVPSGRVAQLATAQQARALPPLDSATLVHTLGGGRAPMAEARMVNAVMRPEAQSQSVPARRAVPHAVPVKASMKCHHLPRLQPARLARLRTSPQLRTPPQPAQNSAEFSAHAVMVMTQWTEMQNAARMEYSVARELQFRRPNVISAVYVVRTPTGWLIIQI